jgi:hypothetical protein
MLIRSEETLIGDLPQHAKFLRFANERKDELIARNDGLATQKFNLMLRGLKQWHLNVPSALTL